MRGFFIAEKTVTVLTSPKIKYNIAFIEVVKTITTIAAGKVGITAVKTFFNKAPNIQQGIQNSKEKAANLRYVGFTPQVFPISLIFNAVVNAYTHK